MKKRLLIILFLASIVLLEETNATIIYDRDIYDIVERRFHRSMVDFTLPSGTADGQFLYWDITTSTWLNSDVTKLKWNDATNTLLVNTLNLNNPIDISSYTNLVAGTNITLVGDTLNVDDAFLINDGDDTTTGTLTAANFIVPANGSIGVIDGSPQIVFDNINDTAEVTGELDVSKYMAVGDAALQPGIILHIAEKYTLTSAADNTYRYGIASSARVEKTGLANYTGVVTGLRAWAGTGGANTRHWTNALAIRGMSCEVRTDAGAVGTIGGSAALYLDGDFQDGPLVVNYYGLYHDDIFVDNNKLTNAYGIYLEDIDDAQTLNYAIYTNAGIIRFGDNVGFNETNPQEDIHAADTVRADVAFNLNGNDGISGTLVLDDGATERITLVFTGGILTSRTVAASTALKMDWTD